MIRAQVLDTAEPHQGRPHTYKQRVAACPRIGDLLVTNDKGVERIVTVRAVLWTLDDPNFDVQIRAW